MHQQVIRQLFELVTRRTTAFPWEVYENPWWRLNGQSMCMLDGSIYAFNDLDDKEDYPFFVKISDLTWATIRTSREGVWSLTILKLKLRDASHEYFALPDLELAKTHTFDDVEQAAAFVRTSQGFEVGSDPFLGFDAFITECQPRNKR